uniref:Uncharacterized protein n=1 Tax=Nyssomyia neivai TaxID=330878 RepID=A0A1L8D8I0_9DIPT
MSYLFLFIELSHTFLLFGNLGSIYFKYIIMIRGRQEKRLSEKNICRKNVTTKTIKNQKKISLHHIYSTFELSTE